MHTHNTHTRVCCKVRWSVYSVYTIGRKMRVFTSVCCRKSVHVNESERKRNRERESERLWEKDGNVSVWTEQMCQYYDIERERERGGEIWCPQVWWYVCVRVIVRVCMCACVCVCVSLCPVFPHLLTREQFFTQNPYLLICWKSWSSSSSLDPVCCFAQSNNFLPFDDFCCKIVLLSWPVQLKTNDLKLCLVRIADLSTITSCHALYVSGVMLWVHDCLA